MAAEPTHPETPPEPQRSPTCVWSIVESFIRWCESDGKKPNTIKQYRTRLNPFKAHFGPREFSTLTAIEIDDWLAADGKFADGRPKAPDTRRITIISIGQLFQYAVDKCVIEKKPFARLKKPGGRRRKRAITDAEIAAIVKHSSPEFSRIFRAFLQTGARPNELASAKFEHWHKARGLIILQEHKTDHTGKDRKIPVGKKWLPILLEATGDRTEGHLFLSPRGKPWTSAALTQTFSRARKRAGLPDDLVLYLTRHKFGTELCRKKGLVSAKDAMGHGSIKTTEGYIHMDTDADLLSAQEAIGDDIVDNDDVARHNTK